MLAAPWSPRICSPGDRTAAMSRAKAPRAVRTSAAQTGSPSPPITVEFDGGTLVVRSPRRLEAGEELPRTFVWDPRTEAYRGPGLSYRELVSGLARRGLEFTDSARSYDREGWTHTARFEPHPHQREGLEAWQRAGGRGVVVLPTGAGKTFLAELAIARVGRAALVVTPTLDLMQQWYGALGQAFATEVGLLGGGYHEPRPLTVTTYDSAYLHMARLGNRFGMVVFDEVHHLPGASYAMAAEALIAPYRLGLTATPERSDGGEERYAELVGPIVYRKRIRELAGVHLAEYETVQLEVELDPQEREVYEHSRRTYLNFVRANGIRFGQRDGWQQFLRETSRSREGRRALLAYREQRRLALQCKGKLDLLVELLERHREDRVLVFTNDNETVYTISRRFLLPSLTHQTPIKERKEILERFNAGQYPALVTSRVLNEGVDIPAANVAVVLSGTGSVREHVQRLGRILRRQRGKRAVLYEIVARDTNEEFVSERRRGHDAYQR